MCTRELMDLVYGDQAGAQPACSHDHSAAVRPAAEMAEEAEEKAAHPGRRRLLGMAGILSAALAGSSLVGQGTAFASAPRGVQRQDEALAQALARSRGRIADLTYTFDVDFPVLKPYVLTPEIEHYATFDGPAGFNANKLTIDEHTGTHVDGPAHLGAEGAFTSEIPPENLVATLAVIDISARAATNPDTTLQVDDIRRYESTHGRIPAGSFVAVDTGWGARIFGAGDPYTNRDATGTPRFPGLGGDAVQWLIDHRAIVGAGTDTPSLDAGVNLPAPEAHHHLLGANRYGIENIANIGSVPKAGAVVTVGLIKHAHGYGGPVRLLAFH